jgi:hypothetical protein
VWRNSASGVGAQQRAVPHTSSGPSQRSMVPCCLTSESIDLSYMLQHPAKPGLMPNSQGGLHVFLCVCVSVHASTSPDYLNHSPFRSIFFCFCQRRPCPVLTSTRKPLDLHQLVASKATRFSHIHQVSDVLPAHSSPFHALSAPV